MRGAERSLVSVLLSLTPLRMATSMLPSLSPGSAAPSSGASGFCMYRSAAGGLVEAWPLHDSICRGGAWSYGGYSSRPLSMSSGLLLPLTAAVVSGTVGIFTGTTGVRMGMGPAPAPEAERRADGFDDGVRRIVATPGVTMTGPWPEEKEPLWAVDPE